MTNNEEPELLSGLLVNCSPVINPAQEYCLFSALKGGRWDGKLMFYGRAVNGWHSVEKGAELHGAAGRQRLIEDALAPTRIPLCQLEADYPGFVHDAGCDHDPMHWVHHPRLFASGWKGRISSGFFWTAVKKVLHGFLGAEATPPAFATKVAWSNLYKLAPNGGNPTEALADLQRGICCELIKRELRALKPQHVVFFTQYKTSSPENDPWFWSFKGLLLVAD
jgi:hypothetical protein